MPAGKVSAHTSLQLYRSYVNYEWISGVKWASQNPKIRLRKHSLDESTQDRKREDGNNCMMRVRQHFENVTAYIFKGPNKGLWARSLEITTLGLDESGRTTSIELDDTAGIIVTGTCKLLVAIEKCTVAVKIWVSHLEMGSTGEEEDEMMVPGNVLKYG
ncbi:hypothetical protein C8R43DRAFT_961015 [Mycena crocata]|nr:hypothetical protein C8R43DRAFT_961015 [Mycena crocata]